MIKLLLCLVLAFAEVEARSACMSYIPAMTRGLPPCDTYSIPMGDLLPSALTDLDAQLDGYAFLAVPLDDHILPPLLEEIAVKIRLLHPNLRVGVAAIPRNKEVQPMVYRHRVATGDAAWFTFFRADPVGPDMAICLGKRDSTIPMPPLAFPNQLLFTWTKEEMRHHWAAHLGSTPFPWGWEDTPEDEPVIVV